jgi:hypothetical protein
MKSLIGFPNSTKLRNSPNFWNLPKEVGTFDCFNRIGIGSIDLEKIESVFRSDRIVPTTASRGIVKPFYFFSNVYRLFSDCCIKHILHFLINIFLLVYCTQFLPMRYKICDLEIDLFKNQ